VGLVEFGYRYKIAKPAL